MAYRYSQMRSWIEDTDEYGNVTLYYPAQLAWFMVICGVLGGMLLGAAIMALVS